MRLLKNTSYDPTTLLRMHDTFGVPVNELRQLIGVELVKVGV